MYDVTEFAPTHPGERRLALHVFQLAFRHLLLPCSHPPLHTCSAVAWRFVAQRLKAGQ